MGEFGTWIPQLQDRQPPDPYSLGGPFALGQQNFVSAYRNPGASMLLTNGALPVYASSGLPGPQVGRASEPHGWFYYWPSIQHAFVPSTHNVLKEELSTCFLQNPKEMLMPCVDPDTKQNRFPVSNLSGDQTSLVFDPGTVNPLQRPTSWDCYQQGAYHVNGNNHASNRDFPNVSGAILIDEFKGNDDSGAQSEMHEDTEELNALLYSDDESGDTEDDAITSTGHSPSTMTVHDKQNWFDGRDEEVASSCGVTKKQKLFGGGYYDVPSEMNTATSKKHNRSADFDDDAESSCACNRSSGGSREVDLSSSNKKMKKDKIRETVSILQNIIPGVKGKDAMVVLDEAIHYLKSLKFKAEAFVLESL